MKISDALQSQRRVLLDLTYRNRLLNLPKKASSRSITVYDEVSEEVASLLLGKKAMTFAPIPGGSDADELAASEQIQDESEIVLAQPDDGLDSDGVASRHRDTRLQTKLRSEHLQKRLLEIYYESRTMLEEQGVNVLYLALGQLKFRERPGSTEYRHAPIVLIPVVLERKSARDRFHLKWNEEDPQENLSLREKLKVEFGIVLPEFPEAEGFDIGRYFESIRAVIAAQDGWEVVDNAIQLGFFSFSKLLMFLDLDPAKWPEGKGIDENPLVTGLLGEGFAEHDVGLANHGPTFLDQLIPATELKHVMDCDSSQALVIETIRRGQNLVVQGPPGTGKSQTIANLIAAAVGDGKKVLFVAEKMAALEVVKRRLENVSLGPMCLELHSNKANKKTVLEELGRTLAIGRPAAVDAAGTVGKLDELRKQLNGHALSMHAPVGVAALSPFRIIGALARLLPHTGRPPYRLDQAASWSMPEAQLRATTLRELCEHLPAVGEPATNPWRGVSHPPVMRPQAEDLVAATSSLTAALEKIHSVAAALAEALALPAPQTLAELDRQCTIAERLAGAPEFDRSTIGSGVWSAGLDSLREALRSGRTLSDVRARRASSVVEMAWDSDWTSQRLTIAGQGKSLLRWLNGPYRQAVNQLRSVVTGPLPADYEARLALLDDLIAGHKAQRAVKAASTSARSAFGSVWRERETDWGLAESILEWVEKQASAVPGFDLRKLASDISDRPALPPRIAAARAAADAIRREFGAAVARFRLDVATALDGATLDEAAIEAVEARARTWASDVDGLMTWLAYRDVANRAESLGLQPAMVHLSPSAQGNRLAVDQFWTAFYLEMLNEASNAYPDLPRFDGRRHEEVIRQFREWDRKRLEVAQVEAAQAHHASMPKSSIAAGALGTLRSEIARKRGHMALRKLFRLCGSPIQAIKPVFMMSPLSVAQFLEPGAIEFDVLIVDEASQVEPVDALGAIARCKQVVVVGDDKQLPPTSFFARVVGGDEEVEDDEGAQAKDLESILSLCAAKGLPQCMLKWHYRSRHESLIAVSNKEFYEGELFIVPSPDRARTNTGLHFHHLPHGRFDRGNSYKNAVEAAAIAKAVVEHARTRSHLTLGVGAMSVRQRQAISDEIELARRQHPELEQFISAHPNEPFFVKNLENIQGDERDVILISIGYGRAKSDDKMYQNFGPLNADGGHRRLNVLISRARERCEVFSSITADDIRVDANSKHGVIALKTFLKYAEYGDLGVPTMTGRGADSPFEEAVQDVVARHGYEVHNQVGVAGFFIDLAVVDPDAPGRYLLGIECDGATYHSAASARDRDRLRQEILEAHGWSIHRIWSTDWFQRPQAEAERLLAAIRAAKARVDAPVVSSPPKPIPVAPAVVRREEPVSTTSSAQSPSRPYEQAAFRPGNSELAPHEVPVGSMAYTVERIIEVEGPIHEDEIVARVRDLWGLGRAGSRIQTAVQDGLRHALGRGRIVSEGGCFHLKDAPVPVRDRTAASSKTLKKPELLPPQEIREAVVALVRDSHGARREEVTTVVARWLGFLATSQQLRERIDGQIDALVSQGRLSEEAGVLVLGPTYQAPKAEPSTPAIS